MIEGGRSTVVLLYRQRRLDKSLRALWRSTIAIVSYQLVARRFGNMGQVDEWSKLINRT